MPRAHRHNAEGLPDIARDDQRFARDIERKVQHCWSESYASRLFLKKFLPYRSHVPRFDEATFSGVPGYRAENL